MTADPGFERRQQLLRQMQLALWRDYIVTNREPIWMIVLGWLTIPLIALAFVLGVALVL